MKQPAPEIKPAQPKQPDDALKINRQCLHTQGGRQDLIHNLAEQEAPLPCSTRLSVQVDGAAFVLLTHELARPAYSCNGGSPSKILSAQQSLSSFPESDGMHTDGMPRQRAGFARGSISPAHVCGIWSLRSPGSPRGSLALAPALTWLLLIWLHHAIQRSLIDFGIELGF